MWRYIQTNELYHHGIKGQKWGVRNGPPYPLHASAKSSTEKKSEKSSSSRKQSKSSKTRGNTSKTGKTAVESVLARYGYGWSSSNKAISDGKKAVDSQINKTVKAKKRGKKEVETLLKDVNPYHTTDTKSRFFAGSNMNCGLTTVAEELRMRGIKAYARMSVKPMSPDHFETYFKGMHKGSISTLDLGDFGDPSNLTVADVLGQSSRGKKVRKKMEQHVIENFPDGARGSILCNNVFCGHFISFERTGNKVRFDNPQSYKDDLDKFFSTVFTKGTHYGGMRFTRLDDLEINKDTIGDLVSFDIKDTKYGGPKLSKEDKTKATEMLKKFSEEVGFEYDSSLLHKREG